MLINDRLMQVAQEKGLRQSTVFSYRRLFMRLELTDDAVTMEEVQDRLPLIDNINTRRAAAIACRSVLGMPKLRIPKGVPRRYELPDEDTLRLALMQSPHEARGLLMAYAGLRIGEACAVTAKARTGDRLLVDRQVTELFASAAQTGGDSVRVLRVSPVKTEASDVIIPHWLGPIIDSLTDTAVPGSVRESLRRAGQKVGISLNPHMLRHWYITTSLERGMPLSLVSKQARHSDVAVTLRTYSQHKTNDVHRIWG